MKKTKTLLKIFIFFVVFICILFSSIFIYIKLSPKLDLKKTNNITFYDKNNKVFYRGNGSKEWVKLKNIDKNLINATISVEDKRFYKHNGFDYIRILKSVYNNMKNKNIVEGGSTITQQYARNLYLDFDRNWSRKFKEAFLAMKMEINYSKNEILEGYLNTINYGNGVLGIQNASKYYFNKDAKDLTLAEASMLAGIPVSPQEYSPINHPKNAKKRQKIILDSMVRNKYITKKEATDAYNIKLSYYGIKDNLNLSTLMYYKDAAMNELNNLNIIPDDYLQSNGIKIYTNLDLDAQKELDNSFKNEIKDNEEIQASGIMIENYTGKIIALAGGRNYEKSQYNRAIKSKRQVGSTMKTFLYYAALENGFTPSSTFSSEKTNFNIDNYEIYSPNNYANTYGNRQIPMILALAYSDNVYAVKTHLFLGKNKLLNTAKDAGIKTTLNNNVSLPLGTTEVYMKEFVNAYSTIASEGLYNDSYFIRSVKDNKNVTIYKHKDNSKQTLNKNYTFILSELLNNCYDNTIADYSQPTCLSIKPNLTKKYAIKTGSTNTDSWTIGYNKKVTTGIWVGYDSNKKLLKSDSKYSKNIWADTMENYLRNDNDEWYTKPKNVIPVLVNPLNGKIATNNSKRKKIIYYIKGTEPTELDK